MSPCTRPERVAGGRSRRVGDGRLDNGQHILLGAYRETLALMRAVGVDPETALLRLPLALDVQDGMSLVLPAWPAPLHVLAGLARARHHRHRQAATHAGADAFAARPDSAFRPA